MTDTPPQSVSFWDSSGIIASTIESIAQERGMKKSELLRRIVVENLEDYAVEELSDKEQEFLQVKRKEWEEKMHQVIAKDRKKDATFKTFIADQIADMLMRKADKEAVSEWVESQERIFELRLGDGYEDTFQYARDKPEQFAYENRSAYLERKDY